MLGSDSLIAAINSVVSATSDSGEAGDSNRGVRTLLRDDESPPVTVLLTGSDGNVVVF